MEVIEQTQTIQNNIQTFFLWNMVGATNNGLQMLSTLQRRLKK